MTVTYPIDQTWGTWSLTFLVDNGTNIQVSKGGIWDEAIWDYDTWLESGMVQGTAESPDIDCASELPYLMTWIGAGPDNKFVIVQYKTADTAAGLLSESYQTIMNGICIPMTKRKRFIKIKLYLSFDENTVSWALTSLTLYTTDIANRIYDTRGMTYDGKGSRQTYDGAFTGRKYQCAICGFMYRRNEMKINNGRWVCKEHCDDKRQNDRSDIQVRGLK